jgi:uncharacterized protein
MTANIAAVSLSIEGGDDLAAKVNPRLIELSLFEKREAEADELSLSLHNHDGLLAIPEQGVALRLGLGWRSSTEAQPGIVDKGRFLVDEVGASGPPDIVTIRARSANLAGDYRKRRTRSWIDTTLGAIIGDIAQRNGGAARIAGDLAGIAIPAIEQEGTSDMAFVRELGRRFDAIATWKGGRLLFTPIGASATAGGRPLASVVINRRDAGAWSFTQASRDDYDGAEAQWHDPDEARRKVVKTGGKNPRRLPTIYASEEEAKKAAEAAKTRDQRKPFGFQFELAVADPALQPDQRVSLSGWGAKIDGIKWLIKSIETRFGAGGMHQRIEMESS